MKSSRYKNLNLKYARTRLYLAIKELEKAAPRMLDECRFTGSVEIHGKLKSKSKV